MDGGGLLAEVDDIEVIVEFARDEEKIAAVL